MAGAVTKLTAKLGRQGRGEGEGLPFDPTSVEGEVLLHIPVSQIEPDPDQPRRDLGDLTDLKSSIESVGVIQPIIVERAGANYRIIAGERRYTAARELQLETVPAVVRSIDEHQRLQMQVIENLQRKDLDPFELADSYQRLMRDFGVSQGELAGWLKRHGVARSRVGINEVLALTRLAPTIREEYCRMSDRSIPRSVLLEVARESAGPLQDALWQQVKAGELTSKSARAARKSGSAPRSEQRPAEVHKRVFSTERATVAVEFARPPPTDEEVIRALEEAICLAYSGQSKDR